MTLRRNISSNVPVTKRKQKSITIEVQISSIEKQTIFHGANRMFWIQIRERPGVPLVDSPTFPARLAIYIHSRTQSSRKFTSDFTWIIAQYSQVLKFANRFGRNLRGPTEQPASQPARQLSESPRSRGNWGWFSTGWV